MAETTTEAGRRRLTDEKILIPHREVVLTNGKRIVVAPWGLTKGALVLERLNQLQPKMFEGAIDPHSMLSRAWNETVDLVALTVGIERAEMEREPLDGGWTFEDMLRTTEAMLDVCVVRSDGSGALPFLIDLVGRMNEATALVLGPGLAQEQSTGSEPAATSKAGSGNGSASPTRGTRRGRGSRSS